MTARLANITFDCEDALVVARFWSEVLDQPLAQDPEPSPYFASIGGIGHGPGDGPAWLFAKVPEGKTAKNRVHVDLVADDREKEVSRLVELGATRGADHDQYGTRWTVMADPEGNEFCVAQA